MSRHQKHAAVLLRLEKPEAVTLAPLVFSRAKKMRTLQNLLDARGLYVRCPSCDESFSVHKANLFDATRLPPDYAVKYLTTEHAAVAEARKQLLVERAELRRRSFTSTASSGVGQLLEMLTASLPALPIAAQDCRVLLKPLDYIAFVGASAGWVESIQFIEAKTGKQRLSTIQRAIKTTVQNGAVKMRVANHQLPVASP